MSKLQTKIDTAKNRKIHTVLKTNDCEKKAPEDCTDWKVLTETGNTNKKTFPVLVKEYRGKTIIIEVK